MITFAISEYLIHIICITFAALVIGYVIGISQDKPL